MEYWLYGGFEICEIMKLEFIQYILPLKVVNWGTYSMWARVRRQYYGAG